MNLLLEAGMVLLKNLSKELHTTLSMNLLLGLRLLLGVEALLLKDLKL